MLELLVIIVYFLGIVALGITGRRRAREADDFYVAGRRATTPFVTGSLVATIIGGSAIFVTSRLGFVQGLTGAWWLLVGSVGLIVLGVFLARKVREFGLYTLPEMVEKQYDRPVALAGSVLIVVAWIGVIGAQIIAAGNAMGILGIGEPVMWMGIFTLVFVVYTLLGGQQAVIKTDSVQSVIIFVGIFSALGLVLVKLGGFGGLKDALPAGHFDFPVSAGFDGYELVKTLLLVGLTYVVGPDMYSRLFCAKDSKVARRSVLWAALLIMPVALAITLIGMGASALYPDISPGQAFPTVIKDVLPPVAGAIVLAALLCAFMSSADTTLLTASTILSMDIASKVRPSLSQEKLLKLTRGGIVVLGAAALMLAWRLQNIVDAILFAYTIYTGGLIIPVLAGFYKDRLKVNPAGAIAAIVGGGTAALISRLMGIKYLDLASLAISAVLLFGVSYLYRKIRVGRGS